jgi:hypothetical protein
VIDMPVKTDLAGASNYVLQEAISGYSDEAYTNARKLSGTGIVGTNEKIDTSTETFIGQVRWKKPLNPKINIASLTDASEGEKTSYGTDYLRYIKTVRTHGAEKVNMQEVVTQIDGLEKIGRDFGETRGQDEHDAILSVCKGVAIAESLYGAASASGSAGLGGQSFENDPASKRYGFYVDLGAAKLVTAAGTANIGAQRATGFLNAFGMAYKDYEPEFAYLITSPEVFASLRSANLIDEDRVTEGNVNFNTIFQGKFRLIQTRASQGMSTAELTKINTGAGVDIVGTKTSFIVLPGSIAMQPLSVPMPTEIQRDAAAYQGGGTTEIWYRWGYVLAPAGYDWAGEQEEFPSDADYKAIVEDGTQGPLVDATTVADVKGVWQRKFSSALSLGILPVFHS